MAQYSPRRFHSHSTQCGMVSWQLYWGVSRGFKIEDCQTMWEGGLKGGFDMKGAGGCRMQIQALWCG